MTVSGAGAAQMPQVGGTADRIPQIGQRLTQLRWERTPGQVVVHLMQYAEYNLT